MNKQWQRRLNGLVPVVLVLIFFVLAFAWITNSRERVESNSYWSSCLSKWGSASSQRSELVGNASEIRDEKQGAKDRAMRILVDNRGAPNSPMTDAAKIAYGIADDAAVEAERRLQATRDMYPPPQLEDFCTRLKAAKLRPKAPGK